MSIHHGGNIAQAVRDFKIAREDWLDLSTGINPCPYPIPKMEDNVWGRLPDQDRLQALIEAAASHYGVGCADHVTAISGTQALLQVLPRLFEKNQKVRIVGPTYKEHENCWRMAGHDVQDVTNVHHAAEEGDVAVVVNPNNPTGAIYSVSDLLNAAEFMASKGGLLIVDGAFVDCLPDVDVSSYVHAHPNMMVLRSFGKFFGLAGIRLGFMLYAGPMLSQIRACLGPWSVNGPALVIGAQALSDQDWISMTQKNLRKASQRFDDLTKGSQICVVAGCDLFRFCRCEDAEKLYKYLGNKGILIRTFRDFTDHVRIGLPGNEAQWEKFSDAVKF